MSGSSFNELFSDQIQKAKTAERSDTKSSLDQTQGLLLDCTCYIGCSLNESLHK